MNRYTVTCSKKIAKQIRNKLNEFATIYEDYPHWQNQQHIFMVDVKNNINIYQLLPHNVTIVADEYF